MDLFLVLQALFGIGVFVAIAVVLSEQRTLPGWRLLVAGLGLQFLFAFAVFNHGSHRHPRRDVCLG